MIMSKACHLLLFVWLVVGPQLGMGEDVMVLRLQGDRKASEDTIAVYTDGIDSNRKLDSITLCGRFKLFILHACAFFFCLTDTKSDDAVMLAGELWLDRVRVVISKHWNFQILQEHLWMNRWYHICFTYDHEKQMIGTYMDGKLNNHQRYDVGTQIFGSNATLGQAEVQSSQKSFSGELTQVNVWDRALSESEIEIIAHCKMNLQGNYISWGSGWTLNNISSHYVPMDELCRKEMGIKRFWFSLEPLNTALYICQALGSHLPLGSPLEEIAELNRIIPAGAANKCFNRYWTSLTDVQEEGSWKYHEGQNATSLIWNKQEPNGLLYENCAIATENGLHDVDCKANSECVVCSFEGEHKFSFLGTCEDELRNVYFVAYQRNVSELHFMGYGTYYIRKQSGQWIWVDDVYGRVIARMKLNIPNFPMGRRWWILEEPVCGQSPGTLRQLLLSPCGQNEFTCSDATCIPHENRCDFKYDCRDNSDEVDCRLVAFPEDYQHHLPPRLAREEEASLQITLDLIIESLSLKTMDMKLEAVFVLSLTWEDNRLQYRDLKLNSTLNILSNDTLRRLWIPTVNFVNTNGNYRSLSDDGAIMFINRHTNTVMRDKAAPGEVDIYPGNGNTLTIKRKYGMVFKCDLKLKLYPFDQQECFMYLRLISAPRSFLIFNPELSSVQNTGETLLTEYQIGQMGLDHDHASEYSEVKVRVPLRRLHGYAILNIYIPTLVLLIISYFTLFFRPIIFDTRMMAALTVQLVIATLFSQVSASLPKTSYFKMVDVWFIFCISITFLVITFHALVDYSLNHTETKLSAAPVKVVPANNKTESCNKLVSNDNQKKERSIVMTTRISVLLVFVVFNLCYWSYIAA